MTVVEFPQSQIAPRRFGRPRALVIVPMREAVFGGRSPRPCAAHERRMWRVLGVTAAARDTQRTLYEARGGAPFGSPEREVAAILRNLGLPVRLDLPDGAIGECPDLLRLAVELGALNARAGHTAPHPLAALCTALVVAGTRPARRLGAADAAAAPAPSPGGSGATGS